MRTKFSLSIAALLLATPLLASSSPSEPERPRSLQRAVDRYEGAVARARTKFEDEVGRAFTTLEKAYGKDIRRARKRDADLAAFLETDLDAIRSRAPKIAGDDDRKKDASPGFASLADAVGPALELADGSRVPVADALGNRTHALVYFSAGWCPPCRRFTPKLVQYASALGPDAPMAVILVSSDKSAEKQLGYMQKYRMPFYATVWDPSRNGSLKQALCGGKGIPSLTLVDSQGEILARTYLNGAYQGVDGVLEAAARIVPARR
ncbi:MAG: redoxin family protein [Planctomycetes bacterium]|nr:redoxin family protein [Planctomycetota bacterium]